MAEVRDAVAAVDALEPVDPPEDLDCEEFEPDEPQPREATAEARGWGPGWPTDNSSKVVVVRAGGIALSVRKEIAPLVERLVQDTVAAGYALRHGECWGFANRAIRGTQKPSNHSWGLAIDLNSLSNPMGPVLKTDMSPAMVELWTARSFRWGGTYRGRKDAMHFEFMGTPDDATRLITELGATPVTTGTATTTSAAPPTLKRKDRGPDVERLQERLNTNGAALEIDGVFGGATEAAVRAFQEAKGLKVDGIVGNNTWEALGK